MIPRKWKNRQPGSIRQAMKWSLDYARDHDNKAVERIADLMGLSSHWALYKWMENSRLPAILIRPFETACGIDYVTRYIGHSGHKLLIDIPTGKKTTEKDINQLQAGFAEAVSYLLKFYDGKAETEDTISAIYELMEQLAWHKGTVERHKQPDFDFNEGSRNE